MLSRFSQLNVTDLLILVFIGTLSLSIHEYAHARMAYHLGDDTAQKAGRLTLNPLAHLDPIGTLTFILARIGWAKPVPVNPLRFESKWSSKKGLALVSLAGPASNLILSWVSFFIYALVSVVAIWTHQTGDAIVLIKRILSLLYISNLYLAIFNLLPLPPLDGYKIFGSILPAPWYYGLMKHEREIGLAFLLLVIFSDRLLTTIIGFVSTPFRWIIEWPITQLFTWVQNLLL